MRTALRGTDDAEALPVAPRSQLGAMQHQATAIGDEAKRAAELKRIDTALKRLDDQKYGFCIGCGAEIEDRRLEADPATLHCSKCGGDQQ